MMFTLSLVESTSFGHLHPFWTILDALSLSLLMIIIVFLPIFRSVCACLAPKPAALSIPCHPSLATAAVFDLFSLLFPPKNIPQHPFLHFFFFCLNFVFFHFGLIFSKRFPKSQCLPFDRTLSSFNSLTLCFALLCFASCSLLSRPVWTLAFWFH